MKTADKKRLICLFLEDVQSEKFLGNSMTPSCNPQMFFHKFFFLIYIWCIYNTPRKEIAGSVKCHPFFSLRGEENIGKPLIGDPEFILEVATWENVNVLSEMQLEFSRSCPEHTDDGNLWWTSFDRLNVCL